MRSVIKLGTRRSLLAWAQSLGVARELERLRPGLKVDLVGIETRGDKIQETPLNQVDGKEFFVAELDSALRSSAVDMTVHSMKDLSLNRPAELICAAIPRRENPRDVVLFGPHVFEKLKLAKKLRIGTSSPRRLENIPGFLAKALPQLSGKPQLEFLEIRGNVNTRIGRLHEPSENPRNLDGVVLAFAGLIRLWAEAEAREELKPLLKGVRWMILPLKSCPSAPGQGALAVECRTQDAELRKLLSALHDSETARHVSKERVLLSEWGGGCHQAFGATLISLHELGDCFFVRGKTPDGRFVDELHWSAPPQPPASFEIRPWNGIQWATQCSKKEETKNPLNVKNVNVKNEEGGAVFAAHSNSIQPNGSEHFYSNETRLWTSGTASWFRLAAQGLWVEGSNEGFGFNELIKTLEEPVLQLPNLSDWTILTHEEGVKSWKLGKTIATYRVNHDYSEGAHARLSQATHVFWASGSQFLELKEVVSSTAHHACGPGKTAQILRDHHLDFTVFPSEEEWKKWLKIS